MRAFIAIELNEYVRKALLGFMKEARRPDAAVRWVRPEGMHLTLKFLGEISSTQESDIGDALDEVTARHESFALDFSGLGTFPPKSRIPRVIWAGIDQSRPLADLNQDLEDALEPLGFPRERRQFHPHLTLGRVKSPHGLDRILQLVQNHELTPFGSLTVPEVVLFKSTLKPSGAEYSRLHQARLS